MTLTKTTLLTNSSPKAESQSETHQKDGSKVETLDPPSDVFDPDRVSHRENLFLTIYFNVYLIVTMISWIVVIEYFFEYIF